MTCSKKNYLLAKFLDEGLMTETETSGRKRTYGITPKGLAVYERELEHMMQVFE